MKVKFIGRFQNNPEELEYDINEWLKTHERNNINCDAGVEELFDEIININYNHIYIDSIDKNLNGHYFTALIIYD